MAFDGNAYQKGVAQRWRDRQLAGQTQNQPQSSQYQDLGLLMKRLQAAVLLEQDPNAPPEERQLAAKLREQAMSMMQQQPGIAMPFGINFMTGRPKMGPYSSGVNYDNLMNSGQMNPGYWGALQAASNPNTAEIYRKSGNAVNAAQSYLNKTNNQYPTTTFADGRQLQPSPFANAAEDVQRQNYVSNLPPWALKDMGLATSPPRSLNK